MKVFSPNKYTNLRSFGNLLAIDHYCPEPYPTGSIDQHLVL